MSRSSQLHKRLMTRAIRKYEQSLRKESKAERKFQKKLLFKITQLSSESFGSHWEWMSKKSGRGKWLTQDLMRACAIVKKLPNFNLEASSIKKALLVEMVKNPQKLKANAWSEWVDGKLKDLSREEEVAQDDQDRDVPANADAPRSPVFDDESVGDESVGDESVGDDSVGDENDRIHNTASPKSFLGPLNVATGREDRLREASGPNVRQVNIRFPDGERRFPEFLVCPSAQVRASLEAPAMAFVIAAMISQLPDSIPPNLRQQIIDEIKKTDLRVKPSSLPFMDRIKKAAKTKVDKVALTHVVQGLAHAHWKVGLTGAYSFFYNSLRALGIEAVADYDFDWSNIRGTNVHDSEGKELRISTEAPAPRRQRKRLRRPMTARSSLLTRLFTFGGCGNDGKYRHTSHNVVFKSTQHQLDEFLGQLPSLFDARYHIRANAQQDVASDAPAVASDEMPDNTGIPFSS